MHTAGNALHDRWQGGVTEHTHTGASHRLLVKVPGQATREGLKAVVTLLIAGGGAALPIADVATVGEGVRSRRHGAVPV